MLAIIADDLTGALDAAAPFAGRGCSTEVALNIDGITAALRSNPDVLSINLACRDRAARDAQRITRRVLSLLPNNVRLFKKVDSRLKGHIAHELDVMSFRVAMVAPAIPEFGRIVSNGMVSGFGVHVPISVREKLGRHAEKSLIPDVTSQEQMREALKISEDAATDLLVGARGLAEALAQSVTGILEPRKVDIPAGPALFVIGSQDPITVTQVDRLRAGYRINDITAPNGIVEKNETAEGLLTLVQATKGREDCSSTVVSERLATGVVPALTDTATTLLLSGGATAEAIMQKMGVTNFRLLGECMPGLGVAQVGQQCIIAKSGGFGQADTLIDIARTILETIE